MIKFQASLPPIQSSISLGGQEGDATRLKLDCILSAQQIAELMDMRGQVLNIEVTSGLEE